METKEYYGGTYPSAPEFDEEMKTVEIECSFKSYVRIPENLKDEDLIKEYIEDNYNSSDLLEECDKINIENIN